MYLGAVTTGPSRFNSATETRSVSSVRLVVCSCTLHSLTVELIAEADSYFLPLKLHLPRLYSSRIVDQTSIERSRGTLQNPHAVLSEEVH